MFPSRFMNWWNLCITSSQILFCLAKHSRRRMLRNSILYLVMGHLEMRLDKACCPSPQKTCEVNCHLLLLPLLSLWKEFFYFAGSGDLEEPMRGWPGFNRENCWVTMVQAWAMIYNLRYVRIIWTTQGAAAELWLRKHGFIFVFGTWEGLKGSFRLLRVLNCNTESGRQETGSWNLARNGDYCCVVLFS